MSPRAVLWPVVALAALTFCVSVVMFRRRVAEIRAKRIRLQTIATSSGIAAALENTSAADNYRNLFESPVLFYAAAVTAFVTEATGTLLVALLWAYVALRAVHSDIQCTTNRVYRRFQAFAASMGVLFAIWVALAWHLATAAGA